MTILEKGFLKLPNLMLPGVGIAFFAGHCSQAGDRDTFAVRRKHLDRCTAMEGVIRGMFAVQSVEEDQTYHDAQRAGHPATPSAFLTPRRFG